MGEESVTHCSFMRKIGEDMNSNYLYSLKHNGFMDKGWYDRGLYTDHTKEDVYIPTKEEFYKFCPLSPEFVPVVGKKLGYDNGICWVDCELYEEDLITNTRAKRDRLLTLVDDLVGHPLRYAELTSRDIDELQEYRNLLLDVPQQDGFPRDAKFPVAPKCLRGK